MLVRNYIQEDRAVVERIYRAGFAGAPWYEQLLQEEVSKRWVACCSYPGFQCLVAQIEEQVVGFTCWDTPTLHGLIQERGQELGAFVGTMHAEQLVWIRETAVDPLYQGRGIAKMLEARLLDRVVRSGNRTLVVVRRRDDNIPVVRLSRALGFEQTGIKVPSSQQPNTFHEYWYKVL